MTKEEMMQLTIQQLTEYFYMNPECFSLEDMDGNLDRFYFNNSTIVFQSKNDPTSNPRSVAITYNDTMRNMTCHIFFRTLLVGQNPSSLKSDASSNIKVNFKWFNKSYKMFRTLRCHIIDRKRNEDSNEFLKKLHSVFPGTFDDYIFGKPK